VAFAMIELTLICIRDFLFGAVITWFHS